MDEDEDDDGDGEERVPRSPTVVSSMGHPDERTEGDARDKEVEAIKKNQRLGEIEVDSRLRHGCRKTVSPGRTNSSYN